MVKILHQNSADTRKKGLAGTWRILYRADGIGEVFLWCPECGRSECMDDVGINSDGKAGQMVCFGCGWTDKVMLLEWDPKKTLYLPRQVG